VLGFAPADPFSVRVAENERSGAAVILGMDPAVPTAEQQALIFHCVHFTA
jgi:hypothetical protein